MLDAAGFEASNHEARRRWMAVLAKAGTDELEAAWRALPQHPAYRFLRRPESGLVMVRGRIGGTGAAFNLGEMTVTRCVIGLKEDGHTGFAYVAGRDARKAEIAAVLDALLQRPGATAEEELVGTLRAAQAARARRRAGAVAPTKVEFFTMVRQ